MGNGPSLRDINMNLLKEVDTFSFNRAYISYKDEWGFNPTYYAVIDGNTIRTTVGDIRGLLTDKSNGIKNFFINNCKSEFNFNGYDDSRLVEFKGFNGNLGDKTKGQWLDNVPSKVSNLALYTNVTTFAVQLAYMLGYDEVGMVGVDAKYIVRKDVKKVGVYKDGPMKGKPKVVFTEDKDPNHYRSDYHGSNHQTSPDHLNGVSGNDLGPWKSLKSVLNSKNDFKLVSCTKGSKLNGEFFDYVELEDFLKGQK
jgi:hypothetical protein